MKISVIVPVYNAQHYILRAVNSVLSQSYEEFELILVDDGSQDDSLNIVKTLEAKDTRIRVVSQINSGPGAARAKGIELATGEYVFFLDADDHLPGDALENLAKVVEQHPYDVVKGLHYICKDDSCEVVRYNWSEGVVAPNGKKEEVTRYQKMKTSSSFGYLWGTLYRKEFLVDHDLSLENIHLRFMEDTVFNLELFSCGPEYYVLCKPVYYYTIRQNSLSSDTNRDFWAQVSAVVKEYYSFLKQKDAYEMRLDLLIPLAARCFSWAGISSVTHGHITIGRLKDEMKAFAESACMQEILGERTLFRNLFSIASKAEALTYAVFFGALRWKAYHLLAILFACLQLPMNAYVKHALK